MYSLGPECPGTRVNTENKTVVTFSSSKIHSKINQFFLFFTQYCSESSNEYKPKIPQ